MMDAGEWAEECERRVDAERAFSQKQLDAMRAWHREQVEQFRAWHIGQMRNHDLATVLFIGASLVAGALVGFIAAILK